MTEMKEETRKELAKIRRWATLRGYTTQVSHHGMGRISVQVIDGARLVNDLTIQR